MASSSSQIELAQTTDNFGVGLYYPHVHVRDLTWLKASLLYWEKVRRIVPDDLIEGRGSTRHSKHDDPAIEPVYDLVEPVSPKRYLAGAATRFRNLVMPLLERREHLVIDLLDAMPGRGFINIHPDKIDNELKDWLKAEKLAEEIDIEYIMKPEVGSLYMACLASEMSVETHCPPITDTVPASRFAEYITWSETNTHSGYDDDPQAESILKLQLRMPCPSQLERLSFEQIVELRARTVDQRMKFRQAVEELTKDLPTLNDPVALADAVAQAQRTYDAAIREHADRTDDIVTSGVGGLMAVTVPSWITGLGLGASGTILGAGLGLVLGTAAFARFRKELREQRSSPYHYRLQLASRLELEQEEERLRSLPQFRLPMI